MNNRHRRVTKLKTQERKRIIKQVGNVHEAMGKAMIDGLTKGIATTCNSLSKVANRIAKDVEEALRK